MANDKIFISIASYRDTETESTILDAIRKAKNPNRLVIGLCLQDDLNTNIDQISSLNNVKILRFHWKDSLGACWSRSLIQRKLFDNEKYYLQLDSHHRFRKDWDEWLVTHFDMIKQKYNKPILGGYCPGYNLDDHEYEDKPMQISAFGSFQDDGDLFFFPRLISNFSELREKNIFSIPARFLSGHFIFADGIFCHECPYDPNLYFRGEELSLSARAYTHGYDFFHPTHSIIWHEYTRHYQPKHWNDHSKNNGFLITAKQRADKAKEKIRLLLGMEKNKVDFGKYGLGKLRSLHDYELYAGLNFKKRLVHKYAYNIYDRYPLPFKMDENEWMQGFMKKYKILINITNDYITSLIENNAEAITIVCENHIGVNFYRKHISDLHTLQLSNNTYKLEDGMEYAPYKILVYPYYKFSGFGDALTINNFEIVQ